MEMVPCRDEGLHRRCPVCELSGAGSTQPGMGTDPYGGQREKNKHVTAIHFEIISNRRSVKVTFKIYEMFIVSPSMYNYTVGLKQHLSVTHSLRQQKHHSQ